MKFTLVFPSDESTEVSVGLDFIPCPVWLSGGKEILNPHPENPHYMSGDLQHMLDTSGIRSLISRKDSAKVVVICHPVGNGTEEYLRLLSDDLRKERFDPQVVRL